MNEYEIYSHADSALAQMNRLERNIDGESDRHGDIEAVKHHLEIIRRRTDPAV